MIKYYDQSVEINHNRNWPYIHDLLYKILIIVIIGGSGLVKTNVLLNLIKHQRSNIVRYLYVKDPFESKYEFLINGTKKYKLKQKIQKHSLIIHKQLMMFMKI